jgi:hypothetical protein
MIPSVVDYRSVGYARVSTGVHDLNCQIDAPSISKALQNHATSASVNIDVARCLLTIAGQSISTRTTAPIHLSEEQ